MTGSHIPVPPISLLAAKFFAPILAASTISAAALPPRLPAPPALLSAAQPSSPRAGQGFAGMPQFGELVWQNPDGTPGARLCSAVAVDSAGGDLIATAAHCLGGVVSRIGAPMTVAYIPGADNGSQPYGVWYPTRIIRARPLASITGSEHFGTIPAAGTLAVQVGYPYKSPDPVACRTPVRFSSPTQLELDCADFPGGTSGGPVLTNVDPANGIGTLAGVMGGYQGGGTRSDVTYASAFTPAIQQLYQQAAQY